MRWRLGWQVSVAEPITDLGCCKGLVWFDLSVCFFVLMRCRWFLLVAGEEGSGTGWRKMDAFSHKSTFCFLGGGA